MNLIGQAKGIIKYYTMLNSSFYLDAVYTGIVEYPTLLKDFIKTCELDARKENVTSVMFYSKLIEAVKSIAAKFEEANNRDLDSYYRMVNIENSLPIENRYQYPIDELPDINKRRLPLLLQTGGKYRGDLYYSNVLDFTKALNELVQELETEKQPKKNKEENSLKPIDPLELITDLTKLSFYESNLITSIKNWKAGNYKTSCAIFCNILYTKKLFNPNMIKTAIEFAFNRYNGLEIEVMIKKVRKTKGIEIYKIPTEEMERLMSGIKYGKI